MPKTSAKRKRRTKLYHAQEGLCHWCGVKMIYLKKIPPRDTRPEMCTVDHLYARGNPKRYENPRPGEKKWVAACLKCNGDRGDGTNWTPPARQGAGTEGLTCE